MSGPHNRYGKNYDLGLLELDHGDELGFLVGVSRLGIARLQSVAGAWSSLLDEFVSISASQSVRVVDGAWLEPETSSLQLLTRNAAALATYDGSVVRLRYDGVQIFEGVVSSSVLQSSIDVNNLEVFHVTLLAFGFESIRNGRPAVGTATAIYHAGGGSTPVVQWDAGKVRARAADITTLSVTAEDDRADVQLEELLDDEPDVSGTQGELLAELAIRSGLLLDQSGAGEITFRSYQGVPLWQLEPGHLVSGYSVAYDRESANSLAVIRKELDTFVRVFRAGTGRNGIQHTISQNFSDDFGSGTFAAYVPLQGLARPYLASANIPRHDDLPLVARLPIEARFRRSGTTYRAAITTMVHTIGKDRWMIGVTGAPVHMVTRIGDDAPGPARHLDGSVAGTTATLTWSTEAAGTISATGSPGFFRLPTAAADVVDVGDDLRLYDSGGNLKEDTIFRVTAKGAPSGGIVNVSVTPDVSAGSVAGDLLRHNDYGPDPDSWVVWYQQLLGGDAFDHRQIKQAVTGFTPESVEVYAPTATITGLTSGQSYRFTVWPGGVDPFVHGMPSLLLELVVP